nr:mediator of RNA polymerase II transcription subunit 34 isoform X2 [Tanacetum cinerariifolium]
MSTLVFADPESSTQADEAQSSRVPIPLSEDPCEAIRKAYLVGTDTESEPFEDPESETHESPHIVAPPTYHTLTHTTPVLVPILRRTAHMAVRVLPVMSSLSAGIEEVAAMPDSAFCKSEDIDESLDSDSESKDAEDEGPTAKDKDPAAGDDGLAMGVEGPGVDDESFGLDDENYDLDDESHGVDDESRGLDDEGRSIESDGLGLGEEEAVPEGQQQAAPVVRTTGSDFAPEPERSERVSALRQPPLTTWTDMKDASSMATSTTTILVDEDQFIEVGAQLELYKADCFTARAGGDEEDRVTALEQERDRREPAVVRQSKKECRRSAFFKHFDEPLQDCNGMCDNRAFSCEVKKIHATGHAKAIVSLLQKTQEMDQRAAMLQLMEKFKLEKIIGKLMTEKYGDKILKVIGKHEYDEEQEASDEELEALLEDQPLPVDASPTALLLGYIADSNLEKDEEDPEEDPADKRDNDDNESSNYDDDDDDIKKDEEEEEDEEHLAPANPSDVPIDGPIPSN